MSVKSAKCKNCGAPLQYCDDKLLYCENCRSLFSEQQDVNNTYINNNITKNYYGDSTQKEIQKDKIDGLLFQVVNSIGNANYSEARNYCISIIQKDPYNWIATVFKGFIENVTKKDNGRYIKEFTIKEFFILLEYISNDPNLDKYYDIFPYCKMLLKKLEILADESFLDLCNTYIGRFENIDNDYVKDFITQLRGISYKANELFARYLTGFKKQRQEKLTQLVQIRKTNLILSIVLASLLFLCILFVFFNVVR